jgi:hypothetical protein
MLVGFMLFKLIAIAYCLKQFNDVLLRGGVLQQPNQNIKQPTL